MTVELKYKIGDRWETVDTDRVVVKEGDQPVAGIISYEGQVVLSTCDEDGFAELMDIMGEDEIGRAITFEFNPEGDRR